MEPLSGFLAVTTLVLLVYCVYTYIRHNQRMKKYSLPPGPKGDFYARADPGNKSQDKVVPMYLHLTKLRDKFGDLFTIEVYSLPYVSNESNTSYTIDLTDAFFHGCCRFWVAHGWDHGDSELIKFSSLSWRC